MIGKRGLSRSVEILAGEVSHVVARRGQHGPTGAVGRSGPARRPERSQPRGRPTGVPLAGRGVDTVGITVDGHPITDLAVTPPDKLADVVFHSPDRFRTDSALLPPERLAAMQGNAAALNRYAGDPYMHDPALRARLESVRLPVRVVWGESDGIADLSYGRAYAAAFAGENDEGAEFVVVRQAGHQPQLEQPDRVAGLVLGSLV